MIAVRPERPGEQNGVFAIHAAAFESDLEARLADRLRAVKFETFAQRYLRDIRRDAFIDTRI